MSTYESILEINPWGTLTTASTTTANIRIRTKNGAQYQVAWGDGTVTTHNSNAVASKTYSVAYAGDVKIRAVNGGLKNIDGIRSDVGAWNFNLSTIGSQFPTMTYEVYFDGNLMTLTGDISSLPTGLTYQVFFRGTSMTLTGNISSLPAGLTYRVYFNGNSMTITGNIYSLPSGLTSTVLFAGNLMTFTGDISSVPSGLTDALWIQGNGASITGDMKTSAPNVTTFNIVSTYADITYTSGRVWKNMSQIYIRQKTAQFTATEVDNIFIDLDASPLVRGAGTIDLRGNSAPPTSASLAARNSLVAKGKTILHN